MSTATSEAPTSTAPPLECDLVMKGGITSGVVYPLAVCELARVYRLRSVGGSSAGAIAAAAAAAAELGRASGGFERLATLPHDLTEKVHGDDSRLFTLFAPQPRMRRLFRVLIAGLGSVGTTRTLRLVLAALRGFAPYAAAGAAPGMVLVLLGFLAGGPAAWVALVAGLMLAAVGLVVGVGAGVLRDVSRMPSADFGLCSGATPPGAPGPALTPWLHQTFQDLAGLTTDDPPLTFGDLERAGIQLKLMTTNLTRRQPLAMPWTAGEYLFDPAHFRTLFPEPVVAAMEHSARERLRDLSPTSSGHSSGTGLLPFPAAVDLPILVAVRMSLSFPGLITAVPLLAARPDGSPHLNWFSDGGICANLPLHFFDATLPRRPTFAIDLADFPRGTTKSDDERDNSHLPALDEAGLRRRESVWAAGGLRALSQFVLSIVETARTWVDTAQLGLPGYRDRIVTVFHDDDEGGLNLDMSRATVRALSARGQGAATRLVDRFAGERPGEVPAVGWDHHRWVRFRTAMAAFSGTLTSFKGGYEARPPGTTPYAVWVGIDPDGQPASAPLPAYPFTPERRSAANRRTEGLIQTATEWQTPPSDAFTYGAPEPRPTMRLVPSDRIGRTAPLT